MRVVDGIRSVVTPGRVFWVFVASVVFSAWFFSVGAYADMQAHGGIPDERFGDTAREHLASLDAMGEAGRADYRTFLLWDLVYPLLQAAWMTGFLAIGTKRVPWLPDALSFAPAAALLGDWLENASFLALLAQHPDASVGLAWLAVAAQWLKLLGNVVAGLAAVAFVVHLVMNPVRRG